MIAIIGCIWTDGWTNELIAEWEVKLKECLWRWLNPLHRDNNDRVHEWPVGEWRDGQSES